MNVTRVIKVVLLLFLCLPQGVLEPEVVGKTGVGSVAAMAAGSKTMGTEIRVNTTIDELNQDGDCSLREAVQAANTDAMVDACPAGLGSDTIILPAGIYTLTIEGRAEDLNAQGDLDVSGVLTIYGAQATIQAGTDDTYGIDRVLHVLSYSDLTVQFAHIRYGLAGYGAAPHINGGGIYVAEHGMLSVVNSTISDNWGANGGGITSAADTTVIIVNSQITGNDSLSAGGGLDSLGNASIRDSTFSGNSGIFGGAIYAVGGAVGIDKSTFSGNQAVEMDPGYGGEGGAIYNNGVMNIRNSTFSGNTAVNEGGAVRNSGDLSIRNSTLAGNTALAGGGIKVVTGIVRLTNSILDANLGGNCSGAIVSADYNIDSNDTCGLDKVHDHFFTNPLLGPLADNGGPTWTRAITPFSPAVNTGDCSDGAIIDDQRYIARPQGSACDIGAYEYRNPFEFSVFLPMIRR